MDEIRIALETNGAEVRHTTLDSHYGHGAFTYDSERILTVIKSFVDADCS